MSTDPTSTQLPTSTSSNNPNLNLAVPSLTTGDMTMQNTSTPSITVTSPTHGTTTTIVDAPADTSSTSDQETTQVSSTPATMPILHPPPPPSVTSSVTIVAPPTSPPSQAQIQAPQSTQDITSNNSVPNSNSSNPSSPAPTPSPPSDPQIILSFLHISGRRRTLSFPADTTVARVKEVVWNTWPKEWYDGSSTISNGAGTGEVAGGEGTRDNLKDELPAAPGFIRLFCMGKMWTDESRLSDMRLSSTQPTIVHVAVRPSDVQQPDDSLAKKARRRVGRTASSATGGGGQGISERGGVGGDSRGSGGCCGCIIC